MMSAPSALRRTACARPCPRAAPVISATLPESDWFIGLLSSFRLVAHDLVEWVGAFEHAVGFLAFSPVSHAGLLQCGEAGNLFPEGLHRVHVVVVMTRHPRPGREPGEPGGRHCTRRDEVAMNPSCWDVVVQTVPDEHWRSVASTWRCRTGGRREVMTVIVVDAGAQQISRSVEVAAPAAELYAFAADPRRHCELDGSGTVRDNIRMPAELALGSKFSTNMRVLGVPYRITSTVTALKPNELVEWRHPVG